MSFERIAEEKIRQAMQAGEFDHLKGKGQPLRLEPDNPHQAEGEALAHHLLQQNGFSLPWIEMGREVDADLLALHAWLRAERRLAESASAWRSVQAEFARRVAALNRRIRDINLQAPAAAFQRPRLKVEQEIERALRE